MMKRAEDSCAAVLEALASSDACSGAALAPECQVGERGTKHTAASVVLSNELRRAWKCLETHGNGWFFQWFSSNFQLIFN